MKLFKTKLNLKEKISSKSKPYKLKSNAYYCKCFIVFILIISFFIFSIYIKIENKSKFDYEKVELYMNELIKKIFFYYRL